MDQKVYTTNIFFHVWIDFISPTKKGDGENEKKKHIFICLLSAFDDKNK